MFTGVSLSNLYWHVSIINDKWEERKGILFQYSKDH